MTLQPKDIGYEATIGLEVHVQLNTVSKIFAPDSNTEHENPNNNVHPISYGHPGALPVLNKTVLEKAVLMALSCGSKIASTIYFDRKHYFYPDLPKGYQITQDQAPVAIGGSIPLIGENMQESIALHHIHMEDDAGKSIHNFGNFTAIDLNRAGTPLIEIVTYPCIKTAEEASAVLQEIRRMVRYLDISSAHMEKGEMRCDANISIKPRGAEDLGAKVEIKNMNSFAHVRKAIAYELERQTLLVHQEKPIHVETRTFLPARGITEGMRFKETLNDYRYFPCPDLPPIHLTDAFLKPLREKAQYTPAWYRDYFTINYNLTTYEVLQLTEQYETAHYFHVLSQRVQNARSAAHFILGPIRKWENASKRKFTEQVLSVDLLTELLNAIEDAKLTPQVASEVILPQMLANQRSVGEIAEANHLWVMKDKAAMAAYVHEVLKQYPKEVEAYRKGKKKLLGMFMGKVMQKGEGKLDAMEVQDYLLKKLNKE